jgi:hypothetical protein
MLRLEEEKFCKGPVQLVSVNYNVSLSFNFANWPLNSIFPFPPSTPKLKGDSHVNRRWCPSHFELGGRWRCRGDRNGEGDGDGDCQGDERDGDI